MHGRQKIGGTGKGESGGLCRLARTLLMLQMEIYGRKSEFANPSTIFYNPSCQVLCITANR